MKSFTYIKATKAAKTVKAAKPAKTALKKPQKYMNVGGVGSSPRSSNSPRSSSSNKNKLIDISYDIVELIYIFKDLSEVSDKKYSFMILDSSKIDFLNFTQEKTKLIRDVIDKIFVKINKSSVIYFDVASYDVYKTKYDKQIDNVIYKITFMNYKEFIKEAIYTSFFNDLRIILVEFFDYIQKNIKINDKISDPNIIDTVKKEILRCATGGYMWINDKKNKENGDNNIKSFMEKQKNKVIAYYKYIEFAADMQNVKTNEYRRR
jgi:hypothetical protein